MSTWIMSTAAVAVLQASIAIRVGPADAPYVPGNEHLHQLREVLESHEALRTLATELAEALAQWEDLPYWPGDRPVPKHEAALAKARAAGVLP